MRRAAVAQRILAIVTNRDCAAAVVGDFLEEEPSRGRRWFWLTVARTAVAFACLNVVRFIAGRHSAFSGNDIMGQVMNFWRFVWTRKWLLVIPVVLFTTATSLVAYSMPVRYRAETQIMVEPQRLSKSLVRSTVQTPIEDRLLLMRLQTLSRTRLEHVIMEFNLYSEERKTWMIEDVIERMRSRDVAIEVEPSYRDSETTTFTVSFTSADPKTAMRVAERLASLFINENLASRMRQADVTSRFLESEVETLATKVDAFAARMERDQVDRRPSPRSRVLQYEELQNTYRTLLGKREEARLASLMENRQVGEQFKVLTPATIPSRPDGPDRLSVSLFGASAGLGLGLVLMVASSRRRPIPPPAATPPA